MAWCKVLVVLNVITFCVVINVKANDMKKPNTEAMSYLSVATNHPAIGILTDTQLLEEYMKASDERRSTAEAASSEDLRLLGRRTTEDDGHSGELDGRPQAAHEPTLIDSIPLLSLSLGINDFYLPKTDLIPENETQCLNDMKAFHNHYNIIGPGSTSLWTIRMMDAWGKVPDGFLFGNVHAVGMFEECVQLEVAVEGKDELLVNYQDTVIKGRYCTIAYGNLDDIITNNSSGSDDSRSGPALAVLANPLPFSYASCIPSSCSEGTLLASVEDKLASVGRSLVSVHCQDRDQELVLENKDVAMLSVLALLLFVVLTATIADSTARGLSAEERCIQGSCGPLLHFSLLRTLADTFRYHPPAPRSLNSLHMLRVVTLLWIIICHQYEATVAFTVNTLDAPKYQEPVFAQVITNGWPSVDTFLFVSGLLLGYRLVAGLRGAGGTHAVKMLGLALVRRVLRMLPTLLVVAGFAASLYGHLGSGPTSNSLMTFSRGLCGQYWWRDVTFSNNFISWQDNMQHPVEDCLDNSWYTAVDMQLMLALPLLVLPIAYYRRGGLVWLLSCTVASLAIPLSLTVAYDLPPAPITDLSVHNLPVYYEYMRQLYFPPWSRATPWLVGILGGLLLHSHRWTKGSLSKCAITLNYVIALSVGLAIVTGLYPYNVYPAQEAYPAWVAVTYGTFSKLGWSLALLWVVFSSFTGNAGILGSVLHYPGWQPMSRLSFCIFLVAPLVQRWWLSMQYVPVYYTYLAKLYESCGMVFVSGVVGLVLSVMVERPIRTLTDQVLLSDVRPQTKEEIMRERRQVALQALYMEV